MGRAPTMAAAGADKFTARAVFRYLVGNGFGGGKGIVAVMLTGMGADGAVAMKRLHDDGALTMAQDEASCVVWGMPKAAYEIGAVDTLVPLQKIASNIMKYAREA